MGSQYFSREYKYNVLQAKSSGYLLSTYKDFFCRIFPLLYAVSIGKKKKSLKSLPEAAEGEMYVSAYTLRVGVLDVREHIQRRKIQRIFFFI